MTAPDETANPRSCNQLTELTEEELNEIEARCNAASPGPWNVKPSALCDHVQSSDHKFETGCINWDGNSPGNAAFIAAARSDVPRLLAELRRLRARPDIRDLAAWIEQQPTNYVWLAIDLLGISRVVPINSKALAINLVNHGETAPWIIAAAGDPASALRLLEEEVMRWNKMHTQIVITLDEKLSDTLKERLADDLAEFFYDRYFELTDIIDFNDVEEVPDEPPPS